MTHVSRRNALVGLSIVSCTRRDPTNVGSPPIAAVSSTPDHDAGLRGQVDLLEWSTQGISTRAAIVVPKWITSRVPVLIALHGRGEAIKAPALGALGWPRDYALLRAIERACAPPLTDEDYEGFSDPNRLAQENARLALRPFAGLIVVCPHLPDLDLRKDRDVADFGRFLLEVLLPRVHRETPALTNVMATGIDGVSLGGHVALRVGLTGARKFGAVGALQAAIGEERISDLTSLARVAKKEQPNLALRLTTSSDDYYLAVNQHLSRAWTEASIPHEFAVIPGPHDYPFNRGPGAYEMILWHDRVLSRS